MPLPKDFKLPELDELISESALEETEEETKPPEASAENPIVSKAHSSQHILDLPSLDELDTPDTLSTSNKTDDISNLPTLPEREIFDSGNSNLDNELENTKDDWMSALLVESSDDSSWASSGIDDTEEAAEAETIVAIEETEGDSWYDSLEIVDEELEDITDHDLDNDNFEPQTDHEKQEKAEKYGFTYPDLDDYEEEPAIPEAYQYIDDTPSERKSFRLKKKPRSKVKKSTSGGFISLIQSNKKLAIIAGLVLILLIAGIIILPDLINPQESEGNNNADPKVTIEDELPIVADDPDDDPDTDPDDDPDEKDELKVNSIKIKNGDLVVSATIKSDKELRFAEAALKTNVGIVKCVLVPENGIEVKRKTNLRFSDCDIPLDESVIIEDYFVYVGE